MKKKIIICSIVVIAILAVIVAGAALWVNYLNRSAQAYSEAETILSKYKHYPTGVQGNDFTNKDDDFSELTVNQFEFLPFDSTTVWPVESRMPKGVDTEGILTSGMDPGLGISGLHKQQINGEGVSVAVIDKPIIPDHHEFSGRMTYIEVFKDDAKIKAPHFHGMACASIFAGEKCGVANKAKLFYFAVPDDGKNKSNYTQALLKLIEVNSQLPEKEKIQVVSISDGEWFGKKDKASRELVKTIEVVEKQGIAVVTCAEFPVDFMLAGCPIGKDRNEIDNYETALFWQARYLKDASINPLNNISFLNYINRWVYVPGDYRTTASNAGSDEYAYWGDGGQSWACPYVAGVIALGKQVNPSCGNDEIYQAINKTAARSSSGLRMINPVKFIEMIKD